jgi:asparagine synthase (glutamine-hydrolysing)
MQTTPSSNFKYRLGRKLSSLGARLIQSSRPVIGRVISERLTYLDSPALLLLAESVEVVEREGVAGSIVETGCALGGSSLVIAAHKSPSRPFYCYDVFGMIPPPSEKDGADVHRRYEAIRSGASKGIAGDPYYGYRNDLLETVRGNFKRFGLDTSTHHVHLVQGLYEDTLRVDSPVALAHIDCDWYDSVMVSLERIVPYLARGGRLIIDDYFVYSGCRTAVWDYFRRQAGDFEFHYDARLWIRRNPPRTSEHAPAPERAHR